MIKCEALESFTLGRFNEVKNIVRKGIDTPGQLNEGDVFECPKDLADYLLGGNRFNKAFVRVIEVIPEEEKSIIETSFTLRKPTKETIKKATKKIK